MSLALPGAHLVEQALEIGLGLEPEALTSLSAPLTQALPTPGGEVLLESMADKLASRSGFLLGNPLGFPQQVGW